jgi:cell wall-associated NlpC family hydrolase
MRRTLIRLVIALSVLLALPQSAARAGGSPFTDVPTNYWDYDAIVYVASTNMWMQDYGSSTFKPSTKENRKFLAGALVKAYAPDEPIDPTLHIPDVATSDPYYDDVNVAVKLGWIELKDDGTFAPDNAVKKNLFDRAIILAMGLQDEADGIADIHQADGTPYPFDDEFRPFMSLAAWFDLHYNWDGPDESKDLEAGAKMPRDEVAYSLWTAKLTASWKFSDATVFDDVALANVSGKQVKRTQYELNQIGYPYIYAGEWNKASPPGYCCGTQPEGGMDCSGFVWWTLKKNEGGYNAAQYHEGYSGWSLPQRSSSDMAHSTSTHVSWGNLEPNDIMFFASNGGGSWSDVDHVGIYLGKNWMIHSTGGGPQLEWVGDGWYKDNFVYGRDLNANSSPQTPGSRVASSLAGDDALTVKGA